MRGNRSELKAKAAAKAAERTAAERTAAERTAADWFVALDSGEAGERDDAGLAAWLEAHPERADALARCDAASSLAAELRHDPSLAWAFDEAARLAERRRAAPVAAMPWYRRPALAWGITGLSLAVAALALTLRPPAPTGNSSATSTPVDEATQLPDVSATGSTSASMAVDPQAETVSADPVVLQPGLVVVDARSIAVLPFSSDVGSTNGASPATAAIARQLYMDVVDQLAATPGLYVVDRRSAASYAAAELEPEEIASQLGVRGIVEGRVLSTGGRVQVVMSFTDAADSGNLVHEAFNRPIGEVTGMQSEIASAVLVAISNAAGKVGSQKAVTNEY